MIRCLLLIATIAAAQTSTSKPFAPNQAGFQVSFPGEPKRQEFKVMDGDKELTVESFSLTTKDETIYLVSKTPIATSSAGLEKRLDAAREGALLASKGKLKVEKKISLDMNPGRDLTMETDTQLVRTRIYVTPLHLFQTVAIGSKKAVESKESTAFLDSFQLVR